MQKDLRIKLWTTPSLQIPNEQGAARASSVSLATKRQKFHFNPLPLYTSSRPKRSQSSRQIRLWGKRTNAGPSDHKVQLLPTGPPLPQILEGIEEKHTPLKGLGFDLPLQIFISSDGTGTNVTHQPTTTISPTQQNHFPSLTKYTGRTVKKL